MKPLFAIDLTTNKKNQQSNGKEFLVQTPSAAIAQSLARSSKQVGDTIEKSKLPLPLRIIEGVCGLLGFTFLFGLMRGLTETPFEQAYKNAPWALWLCGTFLAIFGILKFISKQKSKSVLETDESAHAMTSLESVCDAVYTELSVPANARDTDILSFFYKIKNGNIKISERGLQMAQFFNPVYKVYADAENLYLVDLSGKYAIPRASMVAIRMVKKRISIAGWNKVERYNKGIYKQFKLTVNNYGNIFCKCYHILEFHCHSQAYGLYIPCYELPVFETLTGLKAE